MTKSNEDQLAQQSRQSLFNDVPPYALHSGQFNMSMRKPVATSLVHGAWESAAHYKQCEMYGSCHGTFHVLQKFSWSDISFCSISFTARRSLHGLFTESNTVAQCVLMSACEALCGFHVRIDAANTR